MQGVSRLARFKLLLFNLTEVKCTQWFYLQSRLWRKSFAASRPLSSHFLVTSVPPPRYSSSVFPSFLIHFLCTTPSLSSPICSALPPPVFHKHTLYFSPLPSLGSPPVHYNTFPPLLPPFSRFIISLFPSLVTSFYTLPSLSLSLLPVEVVTQCTMTVCAAAAAFPLFYFFRESKTYHLIWLLTVNPVGA